MTIALEAIMSVFTRLTLALTTMPTPKVDSGTIVEAQRQSQALFRTTRVVVEGIRARALQLTTVEAVR